LKQMGREKWLEHVLGKPRVLEGSRETDIIKMKGKRAGLRKDVVVS
jgi:hypothetical protein